MKRYDLEWVGRAYMQSQDLIENELGDWVEWEEVEGLIKDRDKLHTALLHVQTQLQDLSLGEGPERNAQTLAKWIEAKLGDD